MTGERPFTYGAATTLRDGTDVTVVAAGTMVSRALDAAEEAAEQGVSVRVLNMSTIAPLDEEAIRAAMRETRGIVTAEEATTTGGLGAAVAAVVVTERTPVPMRLLGIHREFAPTGTTAYLLEHFGLTAADIRAAALTLARTDA
nr:transketolase C-terminal domain-containing protein [Actinoplanes bogorensis]